LTAAQRERIELDNAVRRGELLEWEDVRRQWTMLVSSAQKRLRAIPASIGPQMTNISDPAAIVARMKNEIDSALQELEGPRESGKASGNGGSRMGTAA
jgi:phage terminase Nu1 subunit (DNA packaging protein)